MDPRTIIATRIDLHLRRHLGVGVDGRRALTDVRYMRDVLLVCDAMVDTDLPLLARQFRVAGERVAAETQQQPGRDAGPSQGWAANTSGFGLSQPPAMPGQSERVESKPWFTPSRWFAN
jgi:hypothetical protein